MRDYMKHILDVEQLILPFWVYVINKYCSLISHLPDICTLNWDSGRYAVIRTRARLGVTAIFYVALRRLAAAHTYTVTSLARYNVITLVGHGCNVHFSMDKCNPKFMHPTCYVTNKALQIPYIIRRDYVTRINLQQSRHARVYHNCTYCRMCRCATQWT